MADKNEAMENLFKAIDIITAERLSNLGYDKTIKATITDDSQSAQGRYTLTDGSSSFDASCDPATVYKKDMMVYVIIPEGNWDNEKLIVGKYSNKGDNYYNYANPSDDFLDVTHNLISDVNAQSLLANDTSRSYVQVWSCDGVEYKGYNRLALKGNFRTWLSSLDVMKGTYGLVLYVVSKESLYDTGDFERTYKFNLFTSDMYGDPFNFETYYLQEKVFDISGLSNIIHMELLLVQNSDFYDVENNLVEYKDARGEVFPDNIFVQNPYISLGYDLNDVIEDDVRLYTLDAETYDATYDENRRQKTMNVRWIHIQEDGVPIAIDQEEEIPSNSVIRWYKYVLDRAVADKVAGALWEEVEEARNTFSYSFIPNIEASGEKFKVVVESPSREAIIALLQESEFGDFSATNIEDKEGQTTTDLEVLQNALHSYNDNTLQSFQEYKQIIEEYNAKYKAQHGVNYINYDKAIIILDNIQRAQSDVCIYRSDILEFKNESYDPVAAAIDLISGLTILVDPVGYNGSYLLYDESGMITNAAEAVRKRTMAATYQSLITGEEILDKAEKIVWYFPLEGSMIYPPQLGTEYTDYEVYSELTDEEIAALELPCKYCRIERAVPEVLEGDAGDEVARQTEQLFRIKDFYTQTATNNTVYCTVFKNGKQYKAESTLVFGTSGTCGTDATFLLQMMEWDTEKQQPTTHPVSALTIGKSVAIVPKFYDYNRNDITEEYLGSHLINYSWDSSEASGEGALQLSTTDVKPNYARIWVDSGATIDKCQYYILKASVSWSIVKYAKDEDGKVQVDAEGNPIVDEQDENIETRDVRLTTFLPIPVRSSDEYTQAVGPTQIIYNKDGANPTYYNSPFVLYKNGAPVEASWMASCREYLKSNPKDSRILNYYPSLDSEGNLTPKSMYLSDGKPYAVEAIVDGNVVWTQPILIIKNKYTSAMLNAWDGELCIDKENGTIMATMVGAGKKEDDNTFSGVLMGDVAGGAGFDERNHKGMGLYGFNHGEQSFGFNIDGTAFIGKAGRGRICMDGNKGTIQSGSYIVNSAGMLIDLDGTDATSAALFAYGPGGAFELNTNSSKPLLEIRSGPEADAGKLIHIGNTKNKDFYIQSYDFNATDKVGTKLNLETGVYETYSDGSWVKINPKGTGGYFVIHDKGRTDGDILHCSSSAFYLQSVNYVEKDTGMKIDLRAGSIDARSGFIGGWTINKSTLTAESITLNSNGSMSGGTDYTWSIGTDGKATFSYITAAKGGKIGPFEISEENGGALYISGGSFKGSTVYLGSKGISLSKDAFWVDTSGTVHLDGDLYIGGKIYGIDWGTSSSGSGSGYSGYNPSGNTFGVDNILANGGEIGKWTITKEGHLSGVAGDYSIDLDPVTPKIQVNGKKVLTMATDKFTVGDKFEIDYSEDKTNLYLGSGGKISSKSDSQNYLQFNDWNMILKGYFTVNGDDKSDYSIINSGLQIDGTRTMSGKTDICLNVVNGCRFAGNLYVQNGTKMGQGVTTTYTLDNDGWFTGNSTLQFVNGILVGFSDGSGSTSGDDAAVGNTIDYEVLKEKLGLGALAYVDDFTKKVKVTLSGSYTTPTVSGSSGADYWLYSTASGYIYKVNSESSIPDSAVDTYHVKVSGSSGGGGEKKTITFTAEFSPTLGPGEGDIELSKTGLTPTVK